MNDLELIVTTTAHNVAQAVDHAEKHLGEAQGLLEKALCLDSPLLDRASALKSLSGELRIIQADLHRAFFVLGLEP